VNDEPLAAAERWAYAHSAHQPLLETLLAEYTRRGAELVAAIAELDRLTDEVDQLRAELAERDARLARVAAAHRHHTRRGHRCWPGHPLDREAARPPAGPAVGTVVESRTDLRTAMTGVPRRRDNAHLPRAIYQAPYIQARGALQRELVACLRTGRALPVPRERSRQRSPCA